MAVLIVALLIAPLAIASTARTGSQPAAAGSAERVVSLGGSVTEIVYALGEGGRLVADDASSLYPEEATRLPRVGYYRSLPLEGLLSQHPDLVIASENAGPPEVLERMQAMGISLVKVSDTPGVASLLSRVRSVAEALGVPAKGEQLVERIQASIDALPDAPATPVRAVVVLLRGGPLLSAGAGTSVDALLEMSGLQNLAKGSQGYKPLSAEALAALAPDLIITSTTSLESAGGTHAFLARPGLASTPAAREGKVVAIDDLLLLGMGPRVAEAVSLLRQAGH